MPIYLFLEMIRVICTMICEACCHRSNTPFFQRLLSRLVSFTPQYLNTCNRPKAGFEKELKKATRRTASAKAY